MNKPRYSNWEVKKAGCHEIYQEKVFGNKDNRSQLNLLIGRLREGDNIWVVFLEFRTKDYEVNWTY